MKINLAIWFLFLFPLGVLAQWNLQIAHGNYDPELIDTTFRSFDVVGDNMIYIYGTEFGNGVNDLYYSVFKSIDGGENWVRYQFPYVINTTWSSIAFTNDTLGYIAGWKDAQPGTETPFMRSLLVMRTTDGGENWTEHFISTEYGIGNSSPVNVDFLVDGRCIIVEPGNTGVYISDIERNIWYPLEQGSTGHMAVRDEIALLFRGSQCTYTIDAFNSSQTKFVFDNASGHGGDVHIIGSDTTLYVAGTGQTGWFYGYSQNNYGVLSITGLSEETLSMSHCLDYFYFADIERVSDRSLLISDITYNGYPFLMSPEGTDEWFSQEFEVGPLAGVQLPRKLLCVNDSLCYALGPNCLYRTTNAGGPPGELIPFTEVTFTTGISEETGIAYQIGPNPFSEWLELRSEAIQPGDVQIQLHDLQGRLVHEEVIVAEQGWFIWSEAGELETGNYLLSVSQGEKLLMVVRVLRE